MSERRAGAWSVGIWMLAVAGLAAAQPSEPERTAGPYVPTPQVIVDRMLQMARVGPKDFVIDLGSGDGRIVRTAARQHGASGFGVDIDAELVERSNDAARREGVAERARFYTQDVFKADVGKATVVTLYVLPDMMERLRPKLLRELRPGTRIVSHDYHFGPWLPDQRVSFNSPEKAEAVGFSSVSLFLWVVPASVSGAWRLDVQGLNLGAAPTLELSQMFQRLNGSVKLGARSFDLSDTKLEGQTIEFGFTLGDPNAERHGFRGRVVGDRMQGEMEIGTNRKRYAWRAIRVPGTGVPVAQ